MSAEPVQDPIVQRLDEISLHLKHLDQRDRMRMIGGAIRNVISIGFFFVFLGGSWYVVNHMAELAKTVAQEAAQQSQQAMKSGSQDFLQQMQDMFKK